MKLALFLNYSKNDLPEHSWLRLEKIIDDIKLIKREDISEELDSAEAVFLKLGEPFSGDDMANFPNLKLIGVLGTGYGRVDIVSAKERGIKVFNIADYATDAVAEFVFAIILNFIRDLNRAKDEATQGNYTEGDFMSSELRGKSLGIIGLGNIGRRVAQIGTNGFGLNLSYWSKNSKNEFVGYAEIEDVLKKSDILTMHVALTPETDKMFGKEELSKIKSGALVINTAPMEIFCMESLKIALKENRFTLILDHADEMEKEDVDFFSTLPNCVMYPPIAYLTEEAGNKKFEIFVENIYQHSIDKTLPNLVN